MFNKSILLFLLFVFVITGSFAQSGEWTKDQQQFYKTMKSLAGHFKGRHYDSTERDFVLKEYVYFDYVLTDTSKTRIKKRVEIFDALFYQMTHFIDSVGLDHLDARPTQDFKNDKTYFEPFSEGRELSEAVPLSLTYFDKRRPNEPIGALVFELKTHKLVSWVIINQGGYRYFLTFNLL